MINLAGLRYRAVFAAAGGPISRVDTCEVRVGDERRFQANAHLRNGLLPPSRARRVYSDAAGSGTHASPLVARHIAISEALERWCYAATALGPLRARYGFEVDPMSNGMAAFPGLFARQARAAAWREAVERHQITAWWEGRIGAVRHPTPWPGVEGIALRAGSRLVTAIVHQRDEEGVTAYGHAAGRSFLEAAGRAVVEMMRHAHVVRSYRLARGCGAIAAPPTCLLERRSLYFASPEGRAEFDRRVEAAPSGPPPPLRVAFDGPVPGPWSRYTDVWRVALHPVSRRYLEDTDRYFLW